MDDGLGIGERRHLVGAEPIEDALLVAHLAALVDVPDRSRSDWVLIGGQNAAHGRGPPLAPLVQ